MNVDDKMVPSDEWIDSLRKRYPTERYVDKSLTRKLRRRARTPQPAEDIGSIIELLQAFLAPHISGPFKLDDVSALTGGSSKKQFAFRLEWHGEDGQQLSERMVLRLQPQASIVETHRLREFQVMKALKGAIPVPDVYWVDSEGEVFGEPALICSFCEGVARPPTDGLITGPTGGFGPRYRRLLGPQFARYLADLGNFDWQESDLSAFDVPKADENEGVIWAINWWQRVWEEDSLEACPLMTLAANWLRDNAPPIDKISLVHGDYKGGNFLFLLDSGEITAILDWELVHLGDRHEDIALVLHDLYGEKDEDGRMLVCGLYPREEFLQEYEKSSRLPVDAKRLHYYEVFTAWRSAVISLSTAPRCALGEKTHMDILLTWVSNCAFPILKDVHRLLKNHI